MNNALQNNSESQKRGSPSCKSMAIENPLFYLVGEIYCISWGYDQTNVDFYQVVGVTAKFVKVRELKINTDPTKFPAGTPAHITRGYCTPLRDDFAGEIITALYKKEQNVFKVDGRYAAHWNCKPQMYTTN
jgi:hypothetical protein